MTRDSDPGLFRHVIGGYGLFGAITAVGLRLAPRVKVERVVELVDVDDLPPAFETRIADGFLWGDCQFAIDPEGDDFLRVGIFSCYRPVPLDTPIPDGQRALSREAWGRLIYLTHTDKAAAGRAYTEHYLSTSGQIYWSDLHQMSQYVGSYHDAARPVRGRGRSRQRDHHGALRAAAGAADVHGAGRGGLPCPRRQHGLRHDPPDRARRRDARCPGRASRTPASSSTSTRRTGPKRSRRRRDDFRRVIDRAIALGGSYYLTYHRFATPAQVEAAYPGIRRFLDEKLARDPEERFQSDWYRELRQSFG